MSNRRLAYTFLLLFILSPLLFSAEVDVFFSPGGRCTEHIATAIDHAERTIFVAAYQLSDETIAEALLNATKRNVSVAIIADRTQTSPTYSKVPSLAVAGLPVFIDTGHRIFHHKFMVIDAKIVITGSYNFTASAATRNAENLLIIRDEKIAELYLANWMRCRIQARPFYQQETARQSRFRGR